MPALPTCQEPFENAPRLCAICRLSTSGNGMRRCSRLVAESPAMQALMVEAAAIASSDASVIIHGESGTGKEVLARTLHANSPRNNKPFVAVNVAALPAELLESELFGHAKGAFTGAALAKSGLFEAADGGTLLLDEIAEMPLSLQAKLLRALQDGEIRRVGDVRPFSVDVRIFCATHQDLRRAVASGRFREDLYYRLKVFTLVVPPLRQRVPDILAIARQLLEKHDHPTGRFTRAAARALESYPWPGNVRELANAVQHGAILSHGEDIELKHLPAELRAPVAPPASDSTLLRPLAEVEREHVMRVLESCGGNQLQAAKILGVSRSTLWRKLRAYEPESAG